MTVTAAVVEGDPFTPTSLVATLRVDTLALEPGPHTLQVQGVGADGFIRAVNVGVVVAPELVLFESAGDGTGADGPDTLWWLLSTLLLGLLLVGVFLTAMRGRRAAD